MITPLSPGPPPTSSEPQFNHFRAFFSAQRQVPGFQRGGDGVAPGHGTARVSPSIHRDLDIVHEQRRRGSEAAEASWSEALTHQIPLHFSIGSEPLSRPRGPP